MQGFVTHRASYKTSDGIHPKYRIQLLLTLSRLDILIAAHAQGLTLFCSICSVRVLTHFEQLRLQHLDRYGSPKDVRPIGEQSNGHDTARP